MSGSRPRWRRAPAATRRFVAELVPVFGRFKEERRPSESFGDFCDRIGVEELARCFSSELNPVG